jgi:hypothetical protein
LARVSLGAARAAWRARAPAHGARARRSARALDVLVLRVDDVGEVPAVDLLLEDEHPHLWVEALLLEHVAARRRRGAARRVSAARGVRGGRARRGAHRPTILAMAVPQLPEPMIATFSVAPPRNASSLLARNPAHEAVASRAAETSARTTAIAMVRRSQMPSP